MNINLDLLKQQLQDVIDVNHMMAKNKTIKVGVNMDLYRQQKIDTFMKNLNNIKNVAIHEFDTHIHNAKKDQADLNEKIFGVHDLFKKNHAFS